MMKSMFRSLAVVSIVAVSLGQVYAAEPSSVPKNALKEMEYRVGEWTSVGFTDGVKQAEPGHELTNWEPGKFCITIRGSFVEEERGEVHATGLVGWNAESKQLVEHWYTSDGAYATFRYSLDKKKDSWIGTFAWIYADGKKVEGPSVVEKKSDDEWEWNASYESDGKKHTWRTINRRVKK